MERCLDLAHGQFRHIAAGARPLAMHTAIRVCEQFNVTLDWLFRGVASSQVHPDVLVNLMAIRSDLTERRDMAERTGKARRRGKVFEGSDVEA
jgi:hypothetical protein